MLSLIKQQSPVNIPIRWFFTLILGCFLSLNQFSQCFEIESILVDGCDGGNEGRNEMVSFKIGSTDLAVADLAVNWPFNNWLGVCQGPVTTAKVNTINASIMACGYLKEPVNGILPAKSSVILVTSEDFTANAQSFANLADTVYIIFQCAGNTWGHFANYASAPSTRTLVMSFGTNTSCVDSATYNVSSLVTQAGTTGAQDGGRVNYTNNGVASYVNYGCQAPYTATEVDAGSNKTTCANTPVVLEATVSGNYTSVLWTGGSGVFSTPTSTNTTYTPGANETGIIKLFCTANRACSESNLAYTDSLFLDIKALPQAVITSTNNLNALCANQPVDLTYTVSNATQSSNVLGVSWMPVNTTTNSLVVNCGITSTIYTLSVTSDCGVSTSSVVIAPLSDPIVSISTSGSTQICSGSSVTLTANSNYPFVWSNGSTNNALSVSTNTTITVTATNKCTSVSASKSISVVANPTITLSKASIHLCNGDSANVVITSNCSSYSWNNGSVTTNTVTLNKAGTHIITATNQCGSVSASCVVSTNTSPSLSISATSTLVCNDAKVDLTVIGGQVPYLWSNSSTTTANITSGSGTVAVSSSNECGTGTASIIIKESVVKADFSYTSRTEFLEAPSNIIFENNSSDEAISFSWNFGDNTTDFTTLNPTHTYDIPNDYTVWLKVSDVSGCSDSVQKTIHINDQINLWIPDAFTPNGDGTNDVFAIKADNLESLTCSIYNRWGGKVYEWQGINGSWDGADAQEGVYVYTVEARGLNNKLYTKQGHITLLKHSYQLTDK